MTRPRTAAVALAPDAEHLWDRLRAEFQLHDDFWLGIVFGAQTVELNELIGRTRDLASTQVGEVQELRITSIADVDQTLRELLSTARPGVLATWLLDDPIARPDVRREWWLLLLRRLNERRDALRAARPGALLLACPGGALGLVREEAPDLWSYRSLTATLETSGARPIQSDLGYQVPQAAVARPRAAEPSEPLSAAIVDHIRQAASALRGGHLATALQAAERAVEASENEQDRAVADGWLALIRWEQPDAAEALRLARRALSSGKEMPAALVQALLEILTYSPILTEQESAAAELVAGARLAVEGAPKSPETLRNLSVALNKVGRIQETRGELDAAMAAFTESLDLRRRLTDQDPTPEALRDLSVSQDNVGRIQQTRGELDAALAAFGESLDLRRRLAEQYSPTPRALRDLSVSLDNVGRIQQTRGELDAALASLTESLNLTRRLAEYSPTPQALRDLAVSLNKVGRIQETRGDLDAALAAFTESLDLTRRLAEYSPTSQALRDLAVSLNKVGGIQETRGDLDTALAAFTESLDLTRRLADQNSPTPQALRDLSVSLDNVGGIQQTRGDLDAALAAFTESLDLTRRLIEQYSLTPQALRDLSVSLNNVGRIHEDRGELDAALAAYAESLDLTRQLAEQYDPTPEALRDLSISLNNVGRTYEQQGDVASASRAYAEGASWCAQLNDRHPGLFDNDQLLWHLEASAQRTAQPAS